MIISSRANVLQGAIHIRKESWANFRRGRRKRRRRSIKEHGEERLVAQWRSALDEEISTALQEREPPSNTDLQAEYEPRL